VRAWIEGTVNPFKNSLRPVGVLITMVAGQQLAHDECCTEQWQDVTQIFDCDLATALAWRTAEHADA
jgi:hypothetical protein